MQKKIRKTYSSKLVNFEMEKINIEDKKERAKINSQNTRKRRKAYIEQLEAQVAALQEQLKFQPQKSVISQFLQERKGLFERLEKAYEQKDDFEIKIMVDSLRYNYGISGVGRMQLLDQYTNQLIELLLPMHMRYLFWVASENCDLFERERQSGEYSYDLQDSQVNCFKQFGLNDEQVLQIQQLQDRIKDQRTAYDNLIISIFRLNQSIKKESESCQGIVDDIRQILTHQQSAEFLITFDKTRFEQLKQKKVYPDCIINTLKNQAKLPQPVENTYYQMKVENKHWEEDANSHIQFFTD